MASLVFSPVHPHFFQPLLPGFLRHLTIPVTFFLRHMEGKDEPKAVKLRLEGRERSWKVKVEGRRFTDGWEEFAIEHGFKMGDMLLFRHEGDMVFHVTAFGPSCCQIQYAPFHPEDDDEDVHHREVGDDDDDDDVGNFWRKINVKKSLKTTEADPSDHTCFRAVVTAAGLRSDILYIPTRFARQNGLNNRKGGIILMNRHGRTWKLDLRYKKLSGHVYIRRGWRSFCNANRQRVGDLFRLKLVQKGATPVLRMLPAESGKNNNIDGSRKYLKTEESKMLSAKPSCNSRKISGDCLKTTKRKTRSRQGVSSLPRQNRFVTLVLTPNCLRSYILRLPRPFVTVNGLDKPGQKITLLDKYGREWPTYLRVEKPYGRVAFGKGWIDFCRANSVKKGDSFTLELIWEDTAPILKFCRSIQDAPLFHPAVDDDDDADDIRGLRRKKKVKKNPETEVDLPDHTCFTAAVTFSGLRTDTFYLPKRFARWNGLENRHGEIILSNGRGRSWTLGLKHKKSSGQAYINQGWRGFCRANGLNTRGFCRFKLAKNNGAVPVLRLISIESINNRNSSEESAETEEKKALDAKLGKGNSPRKCLKTKKTRSRWRVLSVPRENRFVTLTLTPYNLRQHKLHLPKTFTQANGLVKQQKITLLDKDRREWPTYLRLEKPYDRVVMGKGWRDFCRANSIKIGESFTLELIRGDTAPILRLCSKG